MLNSTVSDVFRKVLKLSSEVSECKPLPDGVPQAHQADHLRGDHSEEGGGGVQRSVGGEGGARLGGRGLHSSTSQLNLSRLCSSKNTLSTPKKCPRHSLTPPKYPSKHPLSHKNCLR